MKPDGGQAYPGRAPPLGYEFGPGSQYSVGMSLRDAFAMAALQGIGLGNSGMSQEDIAALAYSIADAMLKERAK